MTRDGMRRVPVGIASSQLEALTHDDEAIELIDATGQRLAVLLPAKLYDRILADLHEREQRGHAGELTDEEVRATAANPRVAALLDRSRSSGRVGADEVLQEVGLEPLNTG